MSRAHSVAAIALLAHLAGAQSIKEFKFDVTTLGGQRITEQSFPGNALIVDLWGTWCGPCRQAVPILEGMYRKYKHYGLEIVGLNYEQGPGDAAQAVRKFASEQGLTYHLALGTDTIRRQLPNFQGYPTLLFFKKGEKGIEFDHLEVGLEADFKGKLESWIRATVGLETIGSEAKPGPGETPPEEGEEGPKPKGPEPLPKGVIFKPGDGDTGFEFEVQDTEGKTLKFSDLKGKPVLLAMTSTWDGEAANTAKSLNKLTAAHADDLHVVAASLEMGKQREENVTKIKAFLEQNGAKYRAFPAGMTFVKKVHLFSGMPMFLLFDKDGTLVLRESGGTYAKIEAAIEAKLQELRK